MDLSCDQVLEYLKFKGGKFIDEEAQNKLREIVKCAVCFEIPKGKNLKVLTCEKGHHFCPSCHKNLKHCGVCRGQFLQGRNFVVEQMITQLGPSFGLSESNPLPPVEPPKVVPGIYNCLHQCNAYLKAGQMLKHIRMCHEQHLLDNVRSNPYLNRVDLMFDMPYSPKNYCPFSVQISDMGLFTIVINITGTCLIGSVHTLADNKDISSLRYKLTTKINKPNCCHEFAISNCDMHEYIYDTNKVLASERCVKLETARLSELISIGETFSVVFSIWRMNENEGKNNNIMTVFFPELPNLVQNDRKTRRNRQRNIRRRKLKMRLNEMKQLEEDILCQFNLFEV